MLKRTLGVLRDSDEENTVPFMHYIHVFNLLREWFLVYTFRIIVFLVYKNLYVFRKVLIIQPINI